MKFLHDISLCISIVIVIIGACVALVYMWANATSTLQIIACIIGSGMLLALSPLIIKAVHETLKGN